MFDEIDAMKRYKSGDKTVYNDIFKAYEPLIGSTVMQYRGTGIPDDALNLETKRIIVSSLKNYDPAKGNFTVHLQNNLKSMFRETNKASQIYIPDARASLYRKFKDTQENMYEKLKREPSDYELADAMKLGVKEIRRLSKETGANIVSDAGMADLDDYEAGDMEVPDNFLKSLRAQLNDPIDQKILDMSMGKGKPPSNSEIGKQTGLSEGAIRLRKGKLIDKIRELS